MTEADLQRLLGPDLTERDTPLPAPAEEDWARIRALCDVELDDTFVAFINLQSRYEYVLNTFVAVDLSNSDPGWNEEYAVAGITQVYAWDVAERRADGRLSTCLIPFADVGNGDYYCLTTEGDANSRLASTVVYLDHENDAVKFVSSSFTDWIVSFPQELKAEVHPVPALFDDTKYIL